MKEAKDIGVRRIVCTGRGEPTVHPRFMEFLEVARKLDFDVVVNTNGSRLEELAVSFVKPGVDEVYVSIDAFNIKLYSSIRRFGDLSTVTRGLLTLRKVKTEKSSLKPTVKAILTVTKVNVGEISRILDYAVTPSPHPQRPDSKPGLPRAVCRISARTRTPHPSNRIPHAWGITVQGRGASAPAGSPELPPHAGSLSTPYL
ncbi:MAG: radical SAM protein [Acidilobaceae archaeon]